MKYEIREERLGFRYLKVNVEWVKGKTCGLEFPWRWLWVPLVKSVDYVWFGIRVHTDIRNEIQNWNHFWESPLSLLSFVDRFSTSTLFSSPSPSQLSHLPFFFVLILSSSSSPLLKLWAPRVLLLLVLVTTGT